MIDYECVLLLLLQSAENRMNYFLCCGITVGEVAQNIIVMV